MALPPVRRREGRSIPVTSRGRVRVDSGNGTSGSAATISATLPPNASPCINLQPLRRTRNGRECGRAASRYC
jgi:hypothetical protein